MWYCMWTVVEKNLEAKGKNYHHHREDLIAADFINHSFHLSLADTRHNSFAISDHEKLLQECQPPLLLRQRRRVLKIPCMIPPQAASLNIAISGNPAPSATN